MRSGKPCWRRDEVRVSGVVGLQAAWPRGETSHCWREGPGLNGGSTRTSPMCSAAIECETRSCKPMAGSLDTPHRFVSCCGQAAMTAPAATQQWGGQLGWHCAAFDPLRSLSQPKSIPHRFITSSTRPKYRCNVRPMPRRPVHRSIWDFPTQWLAWRSQSFRRPSARVSVASLSGASVRFPLGRQNLETPRGRRHGPD